METCVFSEETYRNTYQVPDLCRNLLFFFLPREESGS